MQYKQSASGWCGNCLRSRSIKGNTLHVASSKPRAYVAAIWLQLLFALISPATGRAQSAHRSSTPAPERSQPPSRDQFAGDQSCATCHQREAQSYAATAHHLTSQPADRHSILGSFSPGANVLKTSNPALTFRMSADLNGFHQTAVDQISPGKSVDLSQAMDTVVGAGRKSQTYLYWKEDQLFELPVSYWASTGSWVNSPGYVDGAVRFDRPIYPRCLECHASSFQSLAPPANRYVKESVMLGINCERCHGPGREHVAFYTAHPSQPARETKAAPGQDILNPASFPRSRQVDACALCHAGLGTPLAPALSFRPGDALNKYLQIPPADPNVAMDVHGNQVQLLKQSLCFQKSAMTCSTCHDVHQIESNAAGFSPKCLACHRPQQCGKFPAMGEAIAKDCVNCHMPLRRSVMLFSDSNDQTLQLPVRDHRIAIYRNAQQ